MGFRPFVYRLACQLFLKGYVRNDTNGVLIDVEGSLEQLDRFINLLLDSPPPQALIEELQWQSLSPAGYTAFEIKDSQVQPNKEALISPDIATCEDCLREFFDPADRRYLYPFINCSHCGPRYSITKDIPYDRTNTTMESFVMCGNCAKEYHDPQDRRFHAQPVACPRCGPELRLLNCNQREVVGDVLEQTVNFLKSGKILAIKGIGGYHLACDATLSHAVAELRERKHRWEKPFALMARDVEMVKALCYISPQETHVLASPKRPIVLLRKRPQANVAKEVAPGYKELGIMLPYTPLHHYLLNHVGNPLVMTSGNVSDEPIIYKDEEALTRLKGIADYFLVSNRPIFTRCDDSVVRVHGENAPYNTSSQKGSPEVVIRRARGYVPYPLNLSSPFNRNILACGAMLKNTFCITKGHHAFLGPHIGDLENMETLEAFQIAVERFKKMLYVEPEVVAYDMHPDYLSTQYARGLKEDIIKIQAQHHHAHVVSCMAENGLEGEVIGVAFDGLGYGEDGHLWGGEFLLASPESYRRMAHLEYVPMPGGQKAIKEPWRMALSYLYCCYGEDLLNLNIEFVRKLDKRRWPTLKGMMEKGVNSPLTSSMGRLFDGVSALLGVRSEITYEGQAAIELESASGEADQEPDASYGFGLKEEGEKIIISWRSLFDEILKDALSGVSIPQISTRFHYSITLTTTEICKKIMNKSGQSRVVLSGGVFQNTFLLRLCEQILSREGFEVYIHHRVPTNDGGISLGQAVIADRRAK